MVTGEGKICSFTSKNENVILVQWTGKSEPREYHFVTVDVSSVYV